MNLQLEPLEEFELELPLNTSNYQYRFNLIGQIIRISVLTHLWGFNVHRLRLPGLSSVGSSPPAHPSSRRVSACALLRTFSVPSSFLLQVFLVLSLVRYYLKLTPPPADLWSIDSLWLVTIKLVPSHGTCAASSWLVAVKLVFSSCVYSIPTLPDSCPNSL